MSGVTERLPWRSLLLFALVGTTIAVTVALVDLQGSRATTGGLIHTGPDGPAAALLARDFPDDPQFSFGEHDGPMFYANTIGLKYVADRLTEFSKQANDPQHMPSALLKKLAAEGKGFE